MERVETQVLSKSQLCPTNKRGFVQRGISREATEAKATGKGGRELAPK